MRRAAALLLALAASCSTPPCQELGERLCSCTGRDGDDCEEQVQRQLESVTAQDALCEEKLASCHEPEGAIFCEWLQTDAGKVACGYASAPAE